MSLNDDTGRSRLVRNLLLSWASMAVLIVVGFVMPRIIDFHVGQRLLGVWDFGWSLVSYLGLASLGVGSAVNRYVGRFRATREWERLNRYVASVVLIQIFVALAITVGSIVLSLVLPSAFSSSLGNDAEIASDVILFLGLSLAVSMLFDPARGIITGFHRWGIHNALNVGSHLVASIGMIIALMLGYGLVGMSICYFVATVIAETVRYFAARRACPQIKVKLRAARKRYVGELIRFGFKSLIIALPRALVVQTTTILLLSALGPASVAILSRPLRLTTYVALFVNKFSNLLIPTVGAMQGLGQEAEMRELMFQATRFSAAIALPPTLLLAINGDWIIYFWMGNSYVDHAAVAILASGSFLATAQGPVLSILVGRNSHGKIGVITLLVSIALMLIGFQVASSIGWSMHMAATIIAVGITGAIGFTMPVLACRDLGVSYVNYLRSSFALPMAVNAGLAGILVSGRLLPFGNDAIVVIVSSLAGGIFVLVSYWRYLLTKDHREMILGGLFSIVRRKKSLL